MRSLASLHLSSMVFKLSKKYVAPSSSLRYEVVADEAFAGQL